MAAKRGSHSNSHGKLEEAFEALLRLYRRNPVCQYLARRRATKAAREYDMNTRAVHIRILEDHFSADLVQTTRGMPWFRVQSNNDTWDQSEGSFPERLAKHVYCHLHFNHHIGSEFDLPPRSVDQWISIVELVFKPRAATPYIAHLRQFDAMAGISCAEGFIQEKTVREWLRYIIVQVFMADPSVGKDPRSPPLCRAAINKTKAIQQVHLRGNTILEAWANEPAMRVLSGWQGFTSMDEVFGAHDPDLPEHWTPATGGKQYVYQATTHHYQCKHDSWPDPLAHLEFSAVSPRTCVGSRQMAPKEVPMVFTTFSPLRAFLWAAFQDQMSLMDSSQTLASRRRGWDCNGERYAGLVLFKFRSVQPAPRELRRLTIPEGREKNWGGLDDSLDWPAVVHGLENEQSGDVAASSSSSSCRMNRWRTGWKKGEGAEYLNSQHESTFAITLDVTAPRLVRDSSSHREGAGRLFNRAGGSGQQVAPAL